MKQGVVQDFLRLPGMLGVALLCGRAGKSPTASQEAATARSRLCFYGFDSLLNSQQREMLAQGIQQIMETIPVGFDSFEFQFNDRLVHLYKLDHGIILLVLTADLDDLAQRSYTETANRLKHDFQINATPAIAAFHQLASDLFLAARPASAAPTPQHDEHQVLDSAVELMPRQTPNQLLPAEGSKQVLLGDLLAALNQLSCFSTQYLGATVVANHWKAACSDSEWLSQFQIDRKATISFSEQVDPSQPASLEQQQQVQQWVAAFVDRCGKVIRTFPKTVRQNALDQTQQALLLPNL